MTTPPMIAVTVIVVAMLTAIVIGVAVWIIELIRLGMEVKNCSHFCIWCRYKHKCDWYQYYRKEK